MLNRLILLLSLLGMVVALHLWIQKERKFDQGCWGVASESAPAQPAAGCTNSELEKASVLFGISVAALGYGFYFFTGLLAFASLLLPARGARACQAASEMTVMLALPFTLYLFYMQAFVAHAFCPLCLVSGALVAGLFVLHAIRFWRGSYEAVSSEARVLEIGYASAMGFAAMGVLVAVLLFVDQVGTRRLDQGDNPRQFIALLGQVLPHFIAPERLAEMKPARLNREAPPLDLAAWVTADTPALGARTGASVVVFLDPNCPSCVHEFATVRTLARSHGDRASFHVFSRVLWDYSLLQTQALELARQQGKYFELWQLMFDRQQRGGMDLPAIGKLFRELDLDRNDLENRLAAVRPEVVARREKAAAAGIDSTPTIYLNGVRVDNRSWDEKSLGRLIDQALASSARPAPAAEAGQGAHGNP